MAELFVKQAKEYAAARPSYPTELFEFIASKTPCHHLAWDVGTGSGQAALALARIYDNIVASDTSPKQLEFAPKLPNVRYQLTPPSMTQLELERVVTPESSADLVTVAQALHWFDLKIFYAHVKHVLKKPQGILAAWCYTNPQVSSAIDKVFRRFYSEKLGEYWDAARRLVEEEYRSIEFPFEVVEGEGSTEPVRFEAEREMDLEEFMTYLRSSSAYQMAKEKGVELLTAEMENEFAESWKEDGKEKKVVRFPIFLRIGKVGDAV